MNYIKKFLAITLIFVMQFQSLHASIAVGGWGFSNPVVNGATTTWEAVKNGARTTVAISPSSAQVAKSLLRGGLVGLAMSAVTQALLDGIDYVLDPANNSITYKKKQTGPSGPCSLNGANCDTFEYFYASNSGTGNCDLYARGDSCFSSASSACDALLVPCGRSRVVSYPPERGGDCKLDGSNYTYRINKYKNKSYNPKLTSGLTEKTIPLTTLATQIINLAEQGNIDAKAYIASVVQDMLEHDEEYRKSLEAQLDAKLKEAQKEKKKPCITVSGKVVPVGTYGYRHDKVPPSKPHYPFTGDHYNLYKANQNPNNGKCFWVESGASDASNGQLPPPNSIPIEPFI